MGHNITDDHSIMHVLVNLLKEYAVMTMQLYQVLGEKKLTVQKLCTHLKLFYTTLKEANNWGDLDTVQNVQHLTLKKSFEGECSTCRQQGHESADCCGKEKNTSKCPLGWNALQRTPQHGKSSTFSGRYYVCGEFAHQVANCPKRNDKINVEGNTMDMDQEYVLMADMLKKYNKLDDSTWLCDSGATCHLTNDSTGVYNIIKINETAIIGDGNGLKIAKKANLM